MLGGTLDRVLEAGYAYEACLSGYQDSDQDHPLIEAILRTFSVQEIYLVDRALYSSSPWSPIWQEYSPADFLSRKVRLEVYLYLLEEAWGLKILRLIR